MLKFEFLYDSPVKCEHMQAKLNKKASHLLSKTLMRRTYYGSIINEIPYDDHAATSEARQFFNAAMMCCVKDEFDEALMWWAMGDKLWASSNASVLFEHSMDVQVKVDTLINYATLSVDSWINTMYGSSQTQTAVAHLRVRTINATNLHERLEELRWEWLAHCDEKKKERRELAQSFDELCNYTETGETK